MTVANWARMLAALPSPHRRAISSTLASVFSSMRRASRTRWRVIQRCGVVPVAARNRRAKVRGLMTERAASWDTDTGSWICSAALMGAKVRILPGAPAGGQDSNGAEMAGHWWAYTLSPVDLNLSQLA